MIPRPQAIHAIHTALDRSRVVALLGPRQSGKTTLARQFVPSHSANYFDLEDPISLVRLEQPATTLGELTDLVVIDEIQRRPELLPILRVLVGRDPLPARFLILGSASPYLSRECAESLAGRVEYVYLSGFSLTEVGSPDRPIHWLRGGFPLSFLARTDEDSFAWRKNFTQSFLERDLPQWGLRFPASTMLRFWTMLAHNNGQIWSASEPASSLGISMPTVRRYLDALEDVFMLRVLRPWHANLQKRQVKAPKIYIRDTGLLHYLLGIYSYTELQKHPKLGASWEGYAMEETIKAVSPDEMYFWATHGGAELDLLLINKGKRLGVEYKYADAPTITRSIRTALQDLELNRLIVVYPGDRGYTLSDQVQVLPLGEFIQADPGLIWA